MISLECKKYCCEPLSLIENYDVAILDNAVWHCHHRLEAHDEFGNKRIDEDITAEELIKRNLYYDRPAKELIFLSSKDHSKLHYKTREERKTKETFEKMSLSAKNRHIHHSKEWNENISKAHKGKPLSEEHKKALRNTENPRNKGKRYPGYHWYNNGMKNIRIRCEIAPVGFVSGRLNENRV